MSKSTRTMAGGIPADALIELSADDIDEGGLLRNQHLLVEPTIIDSMRKVSVRATVKQDSDLRIDGEDAGVTFSTASGDELIRFPRSLQVRTPVLECDVDESTIKDMDEAEVRIAIVDVRIEITLPAKPDDPLKFTLFAPDIVAVRRKRIDAALDVLREELAGWTVVRGRHRETEREVGRP